MVKLTIDNREIEVPAGTKVIEAAERLGIVIPRFCYHPALGSVGACRVCAVTFVDGPVKGIQMSCMVNAQDEMVVSTTDAEVVDFRRHVIEWLMLNHPHDCPVCDEGGHCLLQDLTIAGGHGMRRYKGLKRTHSDQYLGPLMQHEMNRCIQCYRCARYYQEFAGGKDLGVMGIGARVYFGRSRAGILESPFSGNIIDICPTGVYTDKPSRYMGRRWDFQRAPSMCLHCSLGCNVTASARYRQAVRHEARPNLDVNGYFICDRGRYGYAYNDVPDRPRQAQGKGEMLGAAEAVDQAAAGLAEISGKNGPQSVAAVGSARSSLETLGILAEQCRERQWTGPVMFNEPRTARNTHIVARSLTADTAVSLGAVSVAENVVAIGVDPINEAPMLAMSLRQARRAGGRITVLDPRPIEMPMDFDHLPVQPSEMPAAINHIIQTACGIEEKPAVEASDMAGRLKALAAQLCGSKRVVVICGTDITTTREIGLAVELVDAMRRARIEAKLFFCLDGPNAFAAGLLTEDLEGIEGLVEKIEADKVKALVVVENDVWNGFPDRQRLAAAMERLEMLVVLDHVASPLVDKADVFLPTRTVYEAGGQWINQEGRVQRAHPVLAGGASIETVGKGDHPPRVFQENIPDNAPRRAGDLLSELTGVSGGGKERSASALSYNTGSLPGALQDGKRIAFERQASLPEEASAQEPSRPKKEMTLLLVDRTFGTERLSKSAAALAELAAAPEATLHPATARRLGLNAEGHLTLAADAGRLTLSWRADERMARNVIVVPRHHCLEWQALGATRMELGASQIRSGS